MELLYKFKLPAPTNTNTFININRRNSYQANNIKNKLKKNVKEIIKASSYDITELLNTPFFCVFIINVKLKLNSDVDNVTLTKDLIDALKGVVIIDDSIEYMPIAPLVLVNKIHLTGYDNSYSDLYIYDLSRLNFHSYFKPNSKGDLVKISGKQRKQIEIDNDLIRNEFNLKVLHLLSNL